MDALSYSYSYSSSDADVGAESRRRWVLCGQCGRVCGDECRNDMNAKLDAILSRMCANLSPAVALYCTYEVEEPRKRA